MPPPLAREILEWAFANEKPLYRSVLDGVAQFRKVRPVFLEHQPRAERFAVMAATLTRPPLMLIANSVLTTWLVKKHTAMLAAFLDALQIAHKDGAVEKLPPSVDDAALKQAVEGLLARFPAEAVAVYLHAFNDLNQAGWANLDALLQGDDRLQFKRAG